MLYPALQEARTDPNLKRADIHVLLYLAGELDVAEFRMVKGWVVGRALRLNRSAVTRSLLRLSEAGYLQPGPRQARGISTYRLVARRPSIHNIPARSQLEASQSPPPQAEVCKVADKPITRRSPLLDTYAAAEYLGVAASHLTHLRLKGGGPNYLKIGRMVRYECAVLDGWLESCRVQRETDSKGAA